MSLAEVRGGFPAVKRLTTLGTTPVHVPVAETLRRLTDFESGRSTGAGRSKYLIVQNHDATNALKLFFHESTATDYVTVPAGTAEFPVGRWEGPVEIDQVWVAAASGTVAACDITFLLRRN